MRTEFTEAGFPTPQLPKNTVVFTVDVEDYFMSPECIPSDTWSSYTPAIQTGMERCLRLLKEYDARATFFFLGWVAERFPELVRETAAQGHEIATHTYDHTFVTQLDENGFARTLERSLTVLRELSPEPPIIGHRAPGFSLEREKPRQFEILKQHGIRYDSSINPFSTYLYGDRSALRHPYRLHGLVEIPPAAIDRWGMRLPVGGGGTLRILPEFYLAGARSRYQAEGYPPVIYVHPWEFVPEHPRISLPFKQKWIHWCGIRSVERKLRRLLENNRAVTMKEYYDLLLLDPSTV